MEQHYQKKLDEYAKKFGISKLTLEPDAAIARERSIKEHIAANEKRDAINNELRNQEFSKHKVSYGKSKLLALYDGERPLPKVTRLEYTVTR
jgi:hypothetical protein